MQLIDRCATKRLLFMFVVPSLAWQNDQFECIILKGSQKKVLFLTVGPRGTECVAQDRPLTVPTPTHINV